MTGADGWVPQRPDPVGPSTALSADPTAVASLGRGRRSRAALADRLPVTLRAATLAPTGRALGGLLLLVVLAAATALGIAWLARPSEQPLPARRQLVGSPLSVTTPAVPPAAAAPAPEGTVLVHVAGAVRRPGVVELPAGSRVADAVEAAGGASRAAATASVNLARVLVDGEQVVVQRRGAQPVAAAPGGPGVSSAGASGSVPTGPVDLNTATMEQLDALPGIGPVLAQRILDWRGAHGRFSSVDELGEVSGIGEATLSDLRPVVTV